MSIPSREQLARMRGDTIVGVTVAELRALLDLAIPRPPEPVVLAGQMTVEECIAEGIR